MPGQPEKEPFPATYQSLLLQKVICLFPLPPVLVLQFLQPRWKWGRRG